jgi:hypothetical protein
MSRELLNLKIEDRGYEERPGSCQSRRPSGTLMLSDQTQQEVPDGHTAG